MKNFWNSVANEFKYSLAWSERLNWFSRVLFVAVSVSVSVFSTSHEYSSCCKQMLMQHMCKCKVKYIVLRVGVRVAATGTPLKFYAY